MGTEPQTPPPADRNDCRPGSKWWHGIYGIFVTVWGWVLLILGAWMALPFAREVERPWHNWPFILQIPIIILGLLLCYAGTSSIGIGKSIRMARKAAKWRPEHGPFILYLRSFQDDDQLIDRPASDRSAPLLPTPTVEAEMAEELKSHGTLVAVGSPREILPEDVGAIRLYFGDDWQDQVHQLMQKARYIVMRPGETKFLVWEIENAKRHYPPQRFVLYVERLDGEKWGKFRKNTAHLFRRVGLPEQCDEYRFVGFDSEWRPQPIEHQFRWDFIDGSGSAREFRKAAPG